MNNQLSFIEKQFPVSKVSKESYKERKANNGQTLTGLGKWWGRKPLILVRAAILGCLIPSSDNPKKDMEIFQKLLSMDKEGLWLRKEKNFTLKELYEIVSSNKKLSNQYLKFFKVDEKGKVKLEKDSPRIGIEKGCFETLSIDDKLAMCMRPEHLSNLSEQTWNEVNQHLNTSAHSLPELVEELSVKRFGHTVKVGDCFCGGGSIPFEAARIGCDSYASDLNPLAGLLTYAALNVCGANSEDIVRIKNYQTEILESVKKEIEELGTDRNEFGDKAVSYLYCVEAKCPECGFINPLSPSWVIGKGTHTIVKWHEKDNCFMPTVKMGATSKELIDADSGSITNSGFLCLHCRKITPISVLKHDIISNSGKRISGLRVWNSDEYQARENDIFHERLYAIKYEHIEVDENGHIIARRYYREPNSFDLQNEIKVKKIVADKFLYWQEQGYIPSLQIEDGVKTSEVIKNRGWSYWHQLFNPRQLLLLSTFLKFINQNNNQLLKTVGLLGLNRLTNFNSCLSRFNSGVGVEKVVDAFFNQALNTLFSYGSLGILSLESCWKFCINSYPINVHKNVVLTDARVNKSICDFWITDPPYADAINYHELSEFFLAWDKKILMDIFPDWYTDSKRILAVKGDDTFANSMIDIYSNLAKHMPDDGMQVVMFTHSDPAVWAQLAVIMWKSGLKVTAAWNIATETGASGLKNGNYVKGTVLLVLRKQTGNDCAFLDEINADIKSEVKNQIDSMQKLDDKEEPNFSDPDYVLAAYAASLKVLTSYSSIEDLDLDFELNQAIKNPAGSKIVSIIENAKKIAYDCVIPINFESMLWKELTNAEKFYIKGLESEKHGDYQISTYQEFARGFSIGGYSQLMASEKANTARLKTPFELGARTINEIPDFEKSITRVVFAGIYAGIKDDNKPATSLNYIKSEIGIGYWEKREMIKQILTCLCDVKDIDNMKSHWTECGEMAEMLLSMVTHDSI